MKRVIFWLGMGAMGLLAAGPAVAQMMGPGMWNMGPGGSYGEWACPYCGRPMGPWMMGPGYGGGYQAGPGYGGGYQMGPGSGGGYGRGPGMYGPGHGMGPGMHGPGYGMGPGMMHRGWGGPGYGVPYGAPPPPAGRQLAEEDARALVENYLQAGRNPNLKLGKITDAGDAFEVEIVTREDSLVDRILVDKNTGWMRSVY